MGVPPPVGDDQQKFYFVSGLPGNLTPETNPAHREMIRKYKEEYAAYVQAREELANRSKGEFFSIEWIGNEAAEGKQRGGSSEKSPKYKTPAKPKRGSAKGRARKGARRRK